ncbi:DUF300 domain protein [Aspergillus sp. HF37]|nr:DUF300 domain protein [Aspergillus sp. HF37]
MTHGRPPVQHAWPLNHCLPKVDISDPHTFLAVKRGILQYTWLKPILAIISIVMKATDTYQEGYLGVASGYLWTGIVYNISVTISLYSLAMFWVCMHDDLTPFRPVPKFLCIKLIIFASYWQGFFLSILQWLGALSNGVAGYTPDNLAAAIQDSLICFEMPIFAIAHWYGFSWHDYADKTISSARMPVKYALRDAFGIRDLIEDTKMTLRGENYGYRIFDSGDNIIPHAESVSRVKRVMDGMRYERGGKGKYWIPRPGEANSRTPLLADTESGRHSHSSRARGSSIQDRFCRYTMPEDTTLDEEDEQLFTSARALEFGDWNYPVITANEVPRDQYLGAPGRSHSVQSSEPVRKSRRHKKSRATSGDGAQVNQDVGQSTPVAGDAGEPRPSQRGAGSSSSSRHGQLVDLVIEDRDAEERARAQAQREFGSAWAGPDHKHFLMPSRHPVDESSLASQASLSEVKGFESDGAEPSWATKGLDDTGDAKGAPWSYGALEEENVWGR